MFIQPRPLSADPSTVSADRRSGPDGTHLRETDMGLFSSKDPKAGVDKSKPHEYKAPKQSPSLDRVACMVCGQDPQFALHGASKPAEETASEMHWS
jgi:hypothetical protein